MAARTIILIGVTMSNGLCIGDDNMRKITVLAAIAAIVGMSIWAWPEFFRLRRINRM